MTFPPAALLCLIGAMWGQDPAPQPPAAPQVQSAGQPAGKTKAHKKAANASPNDRLFFALPNFMTLENGANVQPLTAGQKFKLTARGTFDPIQFVFYGAQAGISQAQDHDEEYGQGMEGYGKRFAVRLADGTLENFMTRAIFPAVLHQDPRYFQLGEGGFLHRALYAISQLVITPNDAGTKEFNYSEVFGSATASAISVYTYHPRRDRGLSNVVQVWGVQVGWDALSNGLKEFWPDIRKRMTKSKSGKTGTQINTAPGSGH